MILIIAVMSIRRSPRRGHRRHGRRAPQAEGGRDQAQGLLNNTKSS